MLVVGVEVVDVVELLVLVGVLDVLLVVVLLVLLELEQSLDASALTVAAPWPRFSIRVVLTLDPSAPTSFENCCAAPAAPEQSPAEIADEIELSWALRLLAWFEESRPLPPPQATTNAIAKPRLPARNARDP